MEDLNTFEQALADNTDVYKEVLKLTAGVQGRFLDLGAGQGRLAKQLIAQGHKDIYACDKHPEYLQIEGMSCQYCDLNHQRLPYNDSFFDAIICTEVIEHLENPRHLLREMSRALAKKGLAILSMPNNLSLRGRLSFLLRGYSSYLKAAKDQVHSAHITLLVDSDIARIFRETDFELIKKIHTKGSIPKLGISWQGVLPFLKGSLFSDNVIFLARKL